MGVREGDPRLNRQMFYSCEGRQHGAMKCAGTAGRQRDAASSAGWIVKYLLVDSVNTPVSEPIRRH